jgi:hypothetical protein
MDALNPLRCRDRSMGEFAMLSDSRHGDPDGPLPATG